MNRSVHGQRVVTVHGGAGVSVNRLLQRSSVRVTPDDILIIAEHDFEAAEWVEHEWLETESELIAA